ncbi:hypothetical protein F3J19_08210 [Burkholderia sp. Ax-1724]|nr:hypothetical protein [Burkholderia sp. Ax-1724]
MHRARGEHGAGEAGGASEAGEAGEASDASDAGDAGEARGQARCAGERFVYNGPLNAHPLTRFSARKETTCLIYPRWGLSLPSCSGSF